MMDMLFFGAILCDFAAMMMQMIASALGRDKLLKPAAALFGIGFALHTGYTVWRGISAGRLPLANQFEFASGFAWACTVLGLFLHARLHQKWVLTASIPAAFLVISYAAFQPMEIKELMPALRSTWFALHIGSATFSYASSASCAFHFRHDPFSA